MEEALYAIWLAENARLSPHRQGMLLREFSSFEEIYRLSPARAAEFGLTSAEQKRFAIKSLRRAQEIARMCEDTYVQLIPYHDPKYPERLRNIPDPPAILYVQGRWPDFAAQPAIAVIGKRKASGYGIFVAERMGYGLSSAGVIVVSGMAEGCDSAAHRGALQGGSPTVAVFGTPIDRCFPSFNAPLLRDICGYGAAVSEYPPGRPYTRSDFPRRNRIISGLSLGVVVCEAGKKSGTIHTVNQALEQGRDVFAVPGAVISSASEGTNELIATSSAQLVVSAQNVLDAYAERWESLGFHPPQPRKESEKAAPPAPPKEEPPRQQAQSIAAAYQSDPPDGLSEDEGRVLAALTGRMQVDDIIEKCGLPAAQALQALTFLEIGGRVRQLPGKFFERNA